ncbi:MAG: cadmium-translocating P-type ATPase [Aquimonas sp.]|nr:cadmium-translocating P-type ATPase [Aquimonas sp.]
MHVTASNLPGACQHCGEALPATPVVRSIHGNRQAYCCTGCAGAAQFISDAGLNDYYQLRAEQGQRVGEEATDFSAFDRDDVQREHSRQVSPDCREITLVVEGMRCAACAWLIDRALTQIEGVEEVQSNAMSGRVQVRWQPTKTPLSASLKRLAALGYSPHLAPGEALEQARTKERNTLLMRLGVAGLGALQTMMFAEALYLDTAGEMSDPTRDFFRWIAFAVAAPVVFYSGWPFLVGMWRELQHRRFGMDTLVASSVLLAYFASLYETVRGGRHVWFDAAVMFVFLLLAARYVERMARQRANAAVDALARARPALAWRVLADGGTEQVPVAQLQPDDLVRVGVGEIVPTDGNLLEGIGEVDEALLSGESRPVEKQIGDALFAGSTVRRVPLQLRVTRTGQDTRLSHLVQLVERAQNSRPKIAQLADRISAHFVAALAVIALGVYWAWSLYTPERAFEVALAVLVVSCPCALSLALPAALATAAGALTRLGALPLKPDALTELAEVDTVIFDKTGTLTRGRPEIRALGLLPAADAQAWQATDALRVAAALERETGHPLAQAFAHIDSPPAEQVRVEPGAGVEGKFDGRMWRLGKHAWACGLSSVGIEDDHGIWLGDGQRGWARFELQDALREDAAEAINALRAFGLRIEILSGDAAQAVEDTASALGVSLWHARQSPEDKLAWVRQRQFEGHRVAMLGDGINDAPVLAGANVSIALGGGASMAHRAADLVLTADALSRIPELFSLARRTRRIIRENLAWALAYNLLALPFTAMGWVTPWMAALGMACSSLLVTLNALRLSRTVWRAASPSSKESP